MPMLRTVRVVVRAEFTYHTARTEGDLLDEAIGAVRGLAWPGPDGPAVGVETCTVFLDDAS